MINIDINIPNPFDKAEAKDTTICLANTTWEEYEYLIQNNFYNYRISYQDKIISIMSPSRNHERIATTIVTLIATYCRIYNIKYYTFGSADIKNPPYTGKQPDASFCFGNETDIPNLAIEVAFSSGGKSDLDKYLNLAVPEVWLWQNERLTIHILEDASYINRDYSQYLNKLTAEILTKYANAGFIEDQLSIEKKFSDAIKSL